MVYELKLAFGFSLFTLLTATGAQTSESVVGDYFFKQNHYSLSFQAYNEQFEKEPSVVNLGKLLDTVLLLKGKTESLTLLKNFLAKHSKKLSDSELKKLREKWIFIGNVFETDDGQNLFLQAQKELEIQEYEQACNLSLQALQKEISHFRVLKQRFTCEKKMKLFAQAKESLALIRESYPLEKEWVEDELKKLLPLKPS